MNSKIYGPLLVIAAAAALTACASTSSASKGAQPPTAQTAQANLAVISNQAAVTEASSPLGTEGPALKPGNGYRKVTKNGETYYCKKEVLTGSRTNAQVNCLTQAEMTALSQNGQDLLNGVRSVPGSQGAMGPNGGTYNSPISN